MLGPSGHHAAPVLDSVHPVVGTVSLVLAALLLTRAERSPFLHQCSALLQEVRA